MVQINRLRLSGFKSFVDKTELDIGNGLNGIVGPNGCGKSNLVEALRWVMGENRAKNMRGGEMEDVIFAGTAARPARSIAEVSVILDNKDGNAPAPFGSAAQLEVTRRIERDKGSQYLVNGKVVRARDVQLLFADALTGAHSPALVSQGRVTQLIGAKPAERRQMLEESAGVASLYTRRHEAELRLKAADENLARLDLVMGEMASRANTLRNQARQAVRYRELSETIRRYESLLAWQDWAATRDRLKKEEARYVEADGAVREALSKSSELNIAATDAFEAVEELRKTDTESRAALQLLRQSAEQMEREAEHRRNEFNDLDRQLTQAQDDLAMADEQSAALIERAAVIAADLEKLDADEAGKPAELAALEEQMAAARDAVREAENTVLTLQDSLRRMQGERANAANALARAEADAARAADRLQTAEQAYEDAHAEDASDADYATAQEDAARLKDERAAAEAALEDAQAKLDAAREAQNAARETLAALTQERDLKAREIKSLEDMLARLAKGHEESMILKLDIPADLARAVAAAAGDTALQAAEDNWSASGEAFGASDWPAGLTPLNTLVDMPAQLAVFASSVGVAADAETAARAAAQLKRGQIMVTREGQIWRWDGLAVTEIQDADVQARIMSMRAQLREAQDLLETYAPRISDAETAAQAANTQREEAAGARDTAQQAVKNAANAFYAAEERAAALQKAVADRAMRRELTSEQRENARAANDTAQQALAEARAAADALEDGAAEDTMRSDLVTAEERLGETRATRDTLSTQTETLRAAIAQTKHLRDSLTAEAARTNDQIGRGGKQSEALKNRLADVGARKDALAPQIAADEEGKARQEIFDRIAAAEEKMRDASDAFESADQKAKSLQSTLKKIEEDGATAREKRAVIQATIAALQAEQTRISTEIQDRFSTSPAALENAVMGDWADSIPAQSKAKSERDSLVRERDDMGAVNLRAEIELTENETEQTRLEAEKADLAAAIERLREGIGALNTEARERIVKTFDQVNTHFKDLFSRLFGGGDAYLKLEGAEDPLECGLEIYAQPPGKSLQSLGLLSGGEQTLTALSMIFAMFLSNPAPVCVLDEVDAPLDDANVDRVCLLLEEMAKMCETRFLIITHHRMTMARMDRLYGVTMGERGVSQLVSVNLAAQGDLLEQHKVA